MNEPTPKRGRGRPSTLTGPWALLAEHLGGVGPLAEALQVSRRTIERWGAGLRPSPLVQAHVSAFAKRRGIDLTW